MRKPVEVPLKLKWCENGVISLLVDEIANAVYIWQYCKAGTADWKPATALSQNTFSTSFGAAQQKGDKYRCLIKVNGKVKYYSKVLTVGKKKFKSENEYRNQENTSSQTSSTSYAYTGQNHTGNSNRAETAGNSNRYTQNSSGPSITDTDGMDGLEFEKFCASILRKNGYSKVRVTQGSGDYGIDILAERDSVSYAIQCKCYSNPVGIKAVQEAFSGKSYYRSMVAVVLTNNYFTDAAIDAAKRTSVVLWDRTVLEQMIKAAYQSKESQKKEQSQYNEERRYKESKRQSYQKQETASSDMPSFFKGCSTWEQIRDRYKKLMQTYHPDTGSGDEEYAKAINDQYSKLKEQWGK